MWPPAGGVPLPLANVDVGVDMGCASRQQPVSR
jgi:hypothetical protein